MQAAPKESPSYSDFCLRAILDNSPVVLIEINRDFTITHLDGNDIALTSDRLLGRSIRELFLHDSPACLRSLEQAFGGEETFAPRCLFLDNYYRIKFIPFDKLVLGVATNITEQLSNKTKFQAIYHSNLLAIAISRPSGEVLKANDAYLKIAGVTSVEGLRWNAITPSEYIPQAEMISAQLRERGYSDLFEKEYLRPDGTRVTVFGMITALPELGTNIAVYLDITNRKLIEDSLRQSLSDREFFINSLSHDLKNPITSVSLGAAMVKRYSSDERISRLADRIGKDCGIVTGLIDSMLEMAKLETGTFIVSPKAISCSKLITESLERLQTLIDTSGQKLILDIPMDCPTVRCDKDRIAQVFSNLVGNAVKYNGKGGTIKISAIARPMEIEFLIQDEGPGVPEDQLKRIFDRFCQLDKRKTGVGLGLAIVKGIIDAHQGRVWATNSAVKGAIFHFTLLRVDA